MLKQDSATGGGRHFQEAVVLGRARPPPPQTAGLRGAEPPALASVRGQAGPRPALQGSLPPGRLSGQPGTSSGSHSRSGLALSHCCLIYDLQAPGSRPSPAHTVRGPPCPRPSVKGDAPEDRLPLHVRMQGPWLGRQAPPGLLKERVNE